MNKKNLYQIEILAFPIFQLSFFSASLYYAIDSLILSIVFIIVAAFFMNFSLHISYHQLVHHPPKNKILRYLLESIVTLLLGVPFHYYKWQHRNHHLYNNDIKDITSTLEYKNGKVVPRSFFKYCMLWFVPKNNYQYIKKQSLEDGTLTTNSIQRMKIESLFNLLIITLLFYFDVRYGLLFGIMFYVGWCFISLHNYGQHLPVRNHTIAFSYYGKFYNNLTANNGLHLEHHENPQEPFDQLKPHKSYQTSNKLPHLLDAIRYTLKS